MLILFVKSQFNLFDAPVHVAAHVRKDGVVVGPHTRIQKVSVKQPVTHRPATQDLFAEHAAPAPAAKRTKLDAFIERHGGAASLGQVLHGLTEQQRMAVINQMATLGGKTPDEVAAMFPAPPAAETEPAPEAAGPERVEHVTGRGKTLRGVVRTDLNGHQAAAIDPYTFRKNGGWFIREKYLTSGAGDAAAPADAVTDEPHETAKRTEVKAAVDKSKAQALKLRAAGEKLIGEAEADSSRDRNTNTHRRVAMAANAERDAERRRSIGKTMVNLSFAIEEGEARHLGGVTTRAAVEALDHLVMQAVYEADRSLSYHEQQQRKGRPVEASDIAIAKLPNVSWSTAAADSSRLIEGLKGKKGGKDLIAEIQRSHGPTQDMISRLKKLLPEKDVKYGVGWWNIEKAAELARLQKLGITDDLSLRQALAEYLHFREGRKAVDPVKEAERALVGQKVGLDFFPTPKALAATMAEMAGIKPGMSVLEPSAGNGHLADAARDAGADVDTIEMSSTLQNVLKAKKHTIIGSDFETHTSAKQYDAVLMNPPFSDRKDALHIMRAWDMVKPGGKLVAIAGEGVFFGSDKKAEAFRAWLDEHGAEVEKLPDNTFMGADQIAQTGANTRLISMAKPAVAAPAAATGPQEGERNADGLAFHDGRWHRDDQPVEWSAETHAKIATDDISKLRADDVYRLFEDLPKDADKFDDLRIYIIENRPDLSATVMDAIDEVGIPKRVNPNAVSDEDKAKSIADQHAKADAVTQYLAGGGQATLSNPRRVLVLNSPDQLKVTATGVYVAEGADKNSPDGRRWAFLFANQVDELAAQVKKPSANPEFEAAEDREDLAETLADNPHSEKAKRMLATVAQRHADAEEPGEPDADSPSSASYRYADTGYIAGSRKEMAASQVISRAKKDGAQVLVSGIDWEQMEANPREAKDLITKSNLFGQVDWETLKAGGMEPGAGFLVDRIYAAIATEPSEDKPQARRDYTLGLQTLRTRLEACTTAAQVTDVLDNLREEYDGKILTADESVEYQALSKQSSAAWEEDRVIDETGNKLRNEAWAINTYKLSQKIENRKKREWKANPEDDAEFAKLTAQRAALEKVYWDYLQSTRARRDELESIRRSTHHAQQSIQMRAFARNKIENPLHRAWNIMGERFVNVLRYRSYKGSDAFAKHVAVAKSGKIMDWTWAEKEVTRAPRISKESVRFQLKVADRYDRVGGRTVTPQSTLELKEQFGLRDVQSGNWVLRDVTSAKFHTEHCAAAFADLADLLGAPDAQISMNGRLAMAFGARGSGAKGFKDGAASAHYESVHRVINLTKMGGGGCLGHEWFHALDNIVKEAEGMGASGVHDFATSNPDILPPGELRDAFHALRNAMLDGAHQATEVVQYTAHDVKVAKHNLTSTYPQPVAKKILAAGDVHAAVAAVDEHFKVNTANLPPKMKKYAKDWRRIAIAHYGGDADGGSVEVKGGPAMSAFAMEAAILDQGGTSYYSQTLEMGARAFQSWVEDRLGEMGRKNDYLSVYADNKFHRDPLTGMQWRPYPEGEERERINKAFDRLFAAVGASGTLAKAMALGS